MADLACRTALAYRGVAHITFPVDLQEQTVGEAQRSKRNVAAPRLGRMRAERRLRPAEADLRRAAEVLNAGKKVAILGRPRRPGRDATSWSRSADMLGAPIVKALLGKAAVPDDSPYTTGGIGLLGTRPSQEAIEELRHAAHGRHAPSPTSSSTRSRARRARVQIDLDPHADRPALPGRGRPGRRQPAHAAASCCRCLERRTDRSFLEKAQDGMEEWRKLMEERGHAHATSR